MSFIIIVNSMGFEKIEENNEKEREINHQEYQF